MEATLKSGPPFKGGQHILYLYSISEVVHSSATYVHYTHTQL